MHLRSTTTSTLDDKLWNQILLLLDDYVMCIHNVEKQFLGSRLRLAISMQMNLK